MHVNIIELDHFKVKICKNYRFRTCQIQGIHNTGFWVVYWLTQFPSKISWIHADAVSKSASPLMGTSGTWARTEKHAQIFTDL
jgi:hypothetical protein